MGEPKIDFMGVFFAEMRTIIKAEVRAALEERHGSGEDLLCIEDAAKEIGCTVTALHKRIQRGHITPDKLGGHDGFKSHMFTRATIAEYKRSKKR